MQPFDRLHELHHPASHPALVESSDFYTANGILLLQKGPEVAACCVRKEEVEVRRREERGDKLWNRRTRYGEGESKDGELGPGRLLLNGEVSWDAPAGVRARTNGTHAESPSALEGLEDIDPARTCPGESILCANKLDACKGAGRGESRDGVKVIDGESVRLKRSDSLLHLCDAVRWDSVQCQRERTGSRAVRFPGQLEGEVDEGGGSRARE